MYDDCDQWQSHDEKWPLYAQHSSHHFDCDELLGLRSLDGANACAGTAVDAFISVDDVLAIFFCNRIGRAFAFAGTASDAIFSNDISHSFHLQVLPGAVVVNTPRRLILLYQIFLFCQYPCVCFLIIFSKKLSCTDVFHEKITQSVDIRHKHHQEWMCASGQTYKSASDSPSSVSCDRFSSAVTAKQA